MSDRGRVWYDPDEPAELAALERLRELEAEFAALSDADLQHFRNNLFVWAMSSGWTGEWNRAPARAVLAAYKRMLRDRPKGS